MRASRSCPMLGSVTMSKYSKQSVGSEETQSSQVKLRALVPKGAAVLDVGCSSGYLGKSLMEGRGTKVWGIEFDAGDAQLAREQGYEEVFQGDVERFDWSKFGTKRFDVVIFADLLEHLKEPAKVLAAVKPLLKPKGTVLASIPNIAHLSIRLELLNGDFVYEPTGILDDTHLRYFTLYSIRQLFEDQGYLIEHVDATIYDLPDDLVAERLKRVGLEFTKKFKTQVADVEAARTYQYIIAARPAAKGGAKSATQPIAPPTKVVAEYSQLQHQAEISASQASSLEVENHRLNHEIQEITGSRRWRWATRLAVLVKPLRRRPRS